MQLIITSGLIFFKKRRFFPDFPAQPRAKSIAKFFYYKSFLINMNHIQSLNFEGGGEVDNFGKIKNTGDHKGAKILKVIPFKTYFTMITGISAIGLIGSIYDIFQGIGIFALPCLAL